MWYNQSFFKYTIGTLLVITIVFVFGKIGYVFQPILTVFSALFLPLLLSIALYYIVRPMVSWTMTFKVPKTLGIVIVFLILIILFSWFAIYSGSLLIQQMQELIQDLPKFTQLAKDRIIQMFNENQFDLMRDPKWQQQIADYVQKALPSISYGFINAISIVMNTASAVLLVPFILFYLLKDDKTFAKSMMEKVPVRLKEEVFKVLYEVDKTLAIYISGQAMIAFILGILMYVGYILIGVKYSFLLAVFVMMTAFVPVLGAIIGVLPAVLVGLAIDPWMAIKIIILAILVQQIEGNFISPNLVGKRLSIHPLTVLLLFIAATALFGFVGMLLVVPVYAVFKVIFHGARKIYSLFKYKALS